EAAVGVVYSRRFGAGAESALLRRPSRAAAVVGTGTSSYAAGRSSWPRHFAAAASAGVGAAVSGPSETSPPLSAEDEAERAKLAQAPPRADVVKNLRNSIVFNVVGMGAAVLGLQSTVGALVAKALTSSSVPYYQGITPGHNPVLAIDIFLVQASANTILSHFLGLSSSLELLRSVTEAAPVPKPA
ncbi:unnamed protein product, partial [Urochloa humidicola]